MAQQSSKDQAATTASILLLVQAQAAARANLTQQAIAFASSSASSFTGWYDTAAITAWATALADHIEAYQRAIAKTTDAYLARVLSLMTGSKVRPIGPVDVATLRAGITHAGAYGRAADAYRYQQAQWDQIARSLAAGDEVPAPDLTDPIQAAVTRVAAVADMDAQLAARGQSQANMDAGEQQGIVTGYRRVIHPERSKGGTCGLCIAASDRLYHARTLLPIHARCECTTLPVIDANDPGSTLNAGDLGRLYDDAGGTAAELLKQTRYQIDEHGELGPVLNPKGAKFRTAKQATRDLNQARRAKTDAQKAADLERIRTSIAAGLPKAQQLATAEPKTWGDFVTQLEARIKDLDQQLAA